MCVVGVCVVVETEDHFEGEKVFCVRVLERKMRSYSCDYVSYLYRVVQKFRIAEN
jgi:hypothetical protein